MSSDNFVQGATVQLRGTNLGQQGIVYMLTWSSTTTSAGVREKLREVEPVETEEQMARIWLLMELLKRRGI